MKHSTYEISCFECNEKYDASKMDRFRKNYCKKCTDKRYRIMNNKPNTGEYKPNFRIIVTYMVNEESHSGYCSDPYDEEEIENEKIVEYPLISSFTNDDIDRDGNVIDVYGKVLYYNLESEPHGNGYCGKKTTYYIKSARVVKSKRKIDLGD